MVRARIKTIGKSTSGFTLTEMLASIVIIAIMASIVIVNVTYSSVTSSRKSCQTDFRTVTAAVNAYQNDAGSLPVDLKALVSGGYLSDPEGSITSSNLIVRTSYQLQLNNGVIGIAI